MFLTIMRTFIHTPNRGLNSGLSHCLSLGAAIKGCLLINIYLIYLIKSTDRLKILKFIFWAKRWRLFFLVLIFLFFDFSFGNFSSIPKQQQQQQKMKWHDSFDGWRKNVLKANHISILFTLIASRKRHISQPHRNSRPFSHLLPWLKTPVGHSGLCSFQ